MNRSRPLLTIAALIAVCGCVQGVWTNRWWPSPPLASALDCLKDFEPRVFSYQSSRLALSEREADRAGVDGDVMRRFRGVGNGHEVVVLLACGQPGPIASHTPEICYDGSGYTIADPRRRMTVPATDGSAEFYSAKFVPRRASEGPPLRVYWCWRGNGGWEAPDNPRLRYAGLRYLYKLYVIQELTGSDEAAENQLTREFLRELLPAL